MFYDLYYDLAELLNDTASDNLTRCKSWINYTLRDLANIYEHESLYKTMTLTGTSYNFDRLTKLTVLSVVSLFSTTSADTMTATVYGYQLASGVRTWKSENIVVNGTATATGSESFNYIDRIELGSTPVGQITISAQSGQVKGAIMAGETSVANDYKRIIKIDASGDVKPMTLQDRKLKWTTDSSIDEKVYTKEGATITLYGTSTPATLTYLTRHPILVEDYDESPLIKSGGVECQDIVEAARLGWGLRFEDEADGVIGKQQYKAKLEEIAGELIAGGDDARSVVLSRRS
jgi:hypothetical protein